MKGRILFVGDLHAERNDAIAIFRQIVNKTPNSVIFLGDMVLHGNRRKEFSLLEKANIKYYWIIGNHDNYRKTKRGYRISKYLNEDNCLHGRVMNIEGLKIAGFGLDGYLRIDRSVTGRRCFEDDYKTLISQKADILVSHDSFYNKQIKEIASSLGVTSVIHGHYWTENFYRINDLLVTCVGECAKKSLSAVNEYHEFLSIRQRRKLNKIMFDGYKYNFPPMRRYINMIIKAINEPTLSNRSNYKGIHKVQGCCFEPVGMSFDNPSFFVNPPKESEIVAYTDFSVIEELIIYFNKKNIVLKDVLKELKWISNNVYDSKKMTVEHQNKTAIWDLTLSLIDGFREFTLFGMKQLQSIQNKRIEMIRTKNLSAIDKNF